MFCEKCGTEMNDNAVFCSKCGQKVNRTSSVNNNTTEDLKKMNVPSRSTDNVHDSVYVEKPNTHIRENNKPSGETNDRRDINIPSASGKDDRRQILAQPGNEKLAKNIKGNIRFSYIVIIINIAIGLTFLLGVSIPLGLLELIIAIPMLVYTNKTKKSLDSSDANILFILGFFSLNPLWVYRYYCLEKDIESLEDLIYDNENMNGFLNSEMNKKKYLKLPELSSLNEKINRDIMIIYVTETFVACFGAMGLFMGEFEGGILLFLSIITVIITKVKLSKDLSFKTGFIVLIFSIFGFYTWIPALILLLRLKKLDKSYDTYLKTGKIESI